MPGFGRDVKLYNPAYIHPSALIYGDVTIRDGASAWPQVVMRAEMYRIDIGPNSNVQDLVMVHVGGGFDTIVGANCSITHHVTLHGCTVGDNCLIGIGATIMDGCVIGENSIVAGGCFLKEMTVIPPNSVVMGSPGKVTRTRNNAAANAFNAFLYRRNAEAYAVGEHRLWSRPEFQAEIETEKARLKGLYGDGT